MLTHLDPLDAETLRAILSEPKNALIKQYKQLFQIEGIRLEIDDEVLISLLTRPWNSSWVPEVCDPFVKPCY